MKKIFENMSHSQLMEYKQDLEMKHEVAVAFLEDMENLMLDHINDSIFLAYENKYKEMQVEIVILENTLHILEDVIQKNDISMEGMIRRFFEN